MVTCELQGGIGNQIMQIATVQSYGLKHGIDIHIPVTKWDIEKRPVAFPHLFNSKYDNDLPTTVLFEDGFHYQELPFMESWRDGNICIKGYRQSYKYWDQSAEDIRRLLKLPKVSNQDVVSIHHRYGDYKNSPECHPIMPFSYLKKAVEHFKKQGYVDFLCFSDELSVLMDILFDIEGCNFWDSREKTDLEEFNKMSSCKHNIIGNSTFSYMAAFLNTSHDKQVVCPHKSKHFGRAMRSNRMNDYYPENWIQIKF